MIKIAIVGTRGIPAKYGGFETFAQELSVRLVEHGFEVEVYCSNTDNKIDTYKGVKLCYVGCTKDKSPLKYYFESIQSADKAGNDIIVSCGQGGSLAILNRKLHNSKRVFITNTDGIEYKRTKWNWFVRTGVRFVGEFLSVKVSDYLIADSVGIEKYLRNSYSIKKSKVFMIEYGAYITPEFNENNLNNIGLKKNEYFLVVSRLEPENNVSMIIDGYLKSNTKKPLIIVGNLKNSTYVKSLLEKKSDRIKFVGGIYNREALNCVRSGCTAYLHGHSVGGTNPSLLEALGCGNVVVAHDNVFNREVTNNKMFYFASDNECAQAINRIDCISESELKQYKTNALDRIVNYYNWERITKEYIKMFNQIIK